MTARPYIGTLLDGQDTSWIQDTSSISAYCLCRCGASQKTNGSTLQTSTIRIHTLSLSLPRIILIQTQNTDTDTDNRHCANARESSALWLLGHECLDSLRFRAHGTYGVDTALAKESSAEGSVVGAIRQQQLLRPTRHRHLAHA